MRTRKKRHVGLKLPWRSLNKLVVQLYDRPVNAKGYTAHVRRIITLLWVMNPLGYLNEHGIMALVLGGAPHRELKALHSELMKLHDLFQKMSRQSSDAALVSSAEYDEPTKKRKG